MGCTVSVRRHLIGSQANAKAFTELSKRWKANAIRAETTTSSKLKHVWNKSWNNPSHSSPATHNPLTLTGFDTFEETNYRKS